MAQATAVTIIQRVSAEAGIPVAADPFTSTDPNQVLLVRLLNGSGRELVDVYPWPDLDQVLRLDFADSGGAGSFYAPEDLAYIHNQTIWNLDSAQPVSGPMSAQDWYSLKNSITADTTRMYFRRIGPALQFLPDPSPLTTVVEFEYTSSNWVESAQGTAKGSATVSDDIVLLDDHLVSRLLKVRWLEARGMTTAAAAIEFRSALENAIGKARGGARVLGVTGRNYSAQLPPMLTPDTGIGF
jgi:hypothetical protein